MNRTLTSAAVQISIVWLAAGSSLAAQVRSPIQDLLGAARSALNDLRYREADSIAAAVLELEHLRRTERIQALQLRAGALFPEEASVRERERAIEVLRQLVRIAPMAILPREVAWPGVVELHRQVRQATFGVSVSPRDRYTLTGPDEQVVIDVAASKPASFALWLTAAGGGHRALLDSTSGGSRATLRFRILRDGIPQHGSGAYRLEIEAVDDAALDTIRLAFATTLDIPTIAYEPVPGPVEEPPLLPELTRPKRALGVVGGLLVLGGTIAASRLLRDRDLRAAREPDSRAVTLGIVLGVVTAGGVWLFDKGELIPANMEANRRSRATFAKKIADIRARNAERLRTYTAYVMIDPEPLR